eukprot:CAMPEP_0174360510 /NCGR_PEP_ID=MMETSP0811_2-20130205/54519_1 /TAXON_ID=73025 ORGANISM="Eutreptiella gymnastica-like, Strain CCMP1594" /NCGR_SAMPLE_ID=MMETSP0811_2 /ASSEMBLY_ACC=CAM_ASM_000667 /LENGTH=67 /DNA_ID=CAMNT_0015496291 /DNA_START=697 /DNA_END=900 /DNA_ORIENTATION=-
MKTHEALFAEDGAVAWYAHGAQVFYPRGTLPHEQQQTHPNGQLDNGARTLGREQNGTAHSAPQIMQT